MATNDATIIELADAQLRVRSEALQALLRDAIEGNASVGYVWPIDDGVLKAFWDRVHAEVADGERVVLASLHGDEVAGCVHLLPCAKPNQPHRADVQKLLVQRRFRRLGLGRALMRAAEERALMMGRTLLLLDTRTGSGAEALYRSEGWTSFGIVPGFALDPDGVLADCTFFWKRLDPQAGSA